MVLASEFTFKRKKRRIALKERAAAKVQKRVIRFYFDTLPESANENILRWLSTSPRYNWVGGISTQGIKLVLELQCDLGVLARARFETLSVGDIMDFVGYGEWAEELSKNMWITEASSALSLLAIAGKNLKSLIIDEQTAKKMHDFDILDTFSKLSPRVTTLIVLGAQHAAWLEKFGARLLKLYLGNVLRADVVSAAVNCINLKELYVSSVSESSMKRTEFWPKMTQLEKIGIIFSFSCSGEIKKIASHCRKLKFIIIAGQNIRTALTNCFISYGAQLDYAFLHDMKMSQLSKIIAACPNAKFKAWVSQEDPVSTVSIVGSRVWELALLLFKYDPSPSMTRSSWKSCRNVRYLNVRGLMNEKTIAIVFSSPKMYLERLELVIGDADREVDLKKCLDLIANGSGALKNIAFSCSLRSFGAFKKLVQQNPGIRSVDLRLNVNIHVGLEESIIVDTVDTLLKANLLNDLNLNNPQSTWVQYYEGVEKICSRIRLRGPSVYLTVAEHDYMY